jgi:hypothetical protein
MNVLARQSKVASSRRAMFRWTILGVVGAALLWRSRAPQAGAFLAAAALRRRPWDVDSSLRAMRHASLSSFASVPPAPAGKPNQAGLITYHPEYNSFDPKLIDRALAKAAELNVGRLRTDVRWSLLMPDGARVNVDSLAWYRRFLARAQEYGFRNLVVLSTPPASILRKEVDARLQAWTIFVKNVVAGLGQYCQDYQLMNEPNGPVYGFFPRSVTPQAVALGATLIKAKEPGAQVAINVTIDIWGWRRYLTDLLSRSGSAVDVIGLDHYPGTWTIGRQNRWREVYEVGECINSAQPGSVWFKRRLAVMETGFTTNSWFRGTGTQSSYFVGLTNVAAELGRKYGAAFVGVYELCDSDTAAGLDPEAHFGLLTSDLKPKPAFSAVKQLVASML